MSDRPPGVSAAEARGAGPFRVEAALSTPQITSGKDFRNL
jgi:hypothetical protein